MGGLAWAAYAGDGFCRASDVGEGHVTLGPVRVAGVWSDLLSTPGPARPTWSIPQRLVPSTGVSFLVLCLVALR